MNNTLMEQLMNKAGISVALLIILASSTTFVQADAPLKEALETRKESMEKEREIYKDAHEQEREARKKFEEIAREERKHREEMNRKIHKHENEKYREEEKRIEEIERSFWNGTTIK
ncbi:MAG TPA: hypothetical protein PKJ85_01810 [Nitrosomonas nitrosa]|nr:hypothetical protein [Nitrosomonas nitrosa]HNP50514.1 hypothetical protein [Nitrosomonas nitrosa]